MQTQFDLAMTGNQTFSLANLNDKWTVLYFYPRDNTAGCTLEAQEFSQLAPAFAQLGVQIIGVSRDSLASHEKFKEKYALAFDLLSDKESQLCTHYAVLKEKTLYGKKSIGIERSTFIINPQGQIIKEWRKVKSKGHAQIVLDFLQDYLTSTQTGV